MQIGNGKDFSPGLMFIGFGLGFMLLSFNYPMGTRCGLLPIVSVRVCDASRQAADASARCSATIPIPSP